MGKFTKEEEVLLTSYSSNSSTKSSVLFWINAFISSVAPIYLLFGVHQMEVSESWMIGILVGGLSTYALNKACRNQKHLMKHSIVMKRGPAVDREMQLVCGTDKKMTTKEKEERSLLRKNEVADSEATYLSIFFTNVLFFTIFITLGFFLLSNLTPIINMLFSILGASGLVLFLSTAKN